MFEIGRLTRLNLGYTGEANSRPIEICVADWLADWPGAAIGLLLRRPGEDTFYPAKTSVENSVMKYTPTRADVELPGDGLAQIVLTDENDVELRSRVVRTCIEPSLPGSEAEAPEEPMRPFVDQVLEAAARAEAAADEAQTAVEYVAEDAERAVAAADNAEAAAKRAEEAAGMIGPGGGGTGTVTSVNGVQPDEAGNVEIDIPEPPTKLGELEDDAEHRLVSDTEKAAWDAKSNFSGKYEDLSGKPTIPTKLSEMAADATHRLVTDTEKSAWNAKSNFSGKYADLTGKPTIPNVPSWALQSTKPTYTAAEVGALPSTYTPPNQTAAQVGADPAGTASSKVSTHNADEEAHPAIRQLISDLSGRLSALADSDDTTLDQLSEIVAYIKSNKSLIDSITTGKVSTADIVNNLTSTATDKPLSAAQGKALKALIDAIVVPTKLSELAEDTTHRVVTDTEKTAWNAKSTFSGKYADLTGKPTKVSAFENDAEYLTEHQDISHLLPRTELGAAIDDALAEAKESGAFDGEDYILTEADKEEIAGIVPIVKVAEQPTFVDSKDEMTDTSKMYVLKSDGMFYSYKETTIPGETTTTYPNLLVPGAAELNTRYSSSSQSTAAKVGYFVTDYIAVPDFASVTPYNARLDWEVPFSTATDVKVVFFDVSKSYIGTSYIDAANTSVANGKTTIDLRTQSSGTAPTVSDVAYVRLQLAIDSSMASLAASDIENLTITLDAVYETESTEDVTVTEWSSTGIAYNQPADYEDRVISLETTTANNSADINVIKKQIANLESGEATTVIPEWWEDEVADTVAKIKALQAGRNCVTFPFFSDNHQRNGYAGVLIKRVMDECHIPYCFFGGDGISSGYFGDETDAEMREQDAAFDAATAAIPAWQFCRAIGNHEYYWKVSSSETYYYTSDQVYEVFMRENTLAQSKEFGGDTYYYVEDKASKVRWIVMDMNTLDDAAQITWLQNTALSFPESGWAVVLIGHQPVTEHYATVIEGAETARTALKNYINGSAANKADVVGWFAGHIHRDRIFEGVAANPGYSGSTDTETDAAEGDPISETLPWKTVSIISDNVALGYGGVKHAIDNSDQSHAIDFVTINKDLRTVNLTRLGFGSDRSYTY